MIQLFICSSEIFDYKTPVRNSCSLSICFLMLITYYQSSKTIQFSFFSGGYLGFYPAALTAQQLTAAGEIINWLILINDNLWSSGLSAAAAGLPAAYAAGPTAATTPTAGQQAQPAEGRTQ